MIYYPVIIPTLNRYEHLVRLINSLKCNTYADKTELYISVDYPPSEKYKEDWGKIREYLPTICGFAEIHIYEQTHNLGPEKNISFLLNEVKVKYEAYIFTEDDNEFSPCFLDFMNKALEKYKDSTVVTSVCAHGWANLKITSTNKIYFADAFNAWGYGAWFNKKIGGDIDYYFNLLKKPLLSILCLYKRPSSFSLLLEMVRKGCFWGDVCYGIYNMREEKLQVLPTQKLVRNWGDDGSGIHCGSSNQNKLVNISSDTTFDFKDSEIRIDPDFADGAKKHFISNLGFIKQILLYLIVFKNYLLFYPNLKKYRKLYHA